MHLQQNINSLTLQQKNKCLSTQPTALATFFLHYDIYYLTGYDYHLSDSFAL